jgi:hypothetical protein
MFDKVVISEPLARVRLRPRSMGFQIAPGPQESGSNRCVIGGNCVQSVSYGLGSGKRLGSELPEHAGIPLISTLIVGLLLGKPDDSGWTPFVALPRVHGVQKSGEFGRRLELWNRLKLLERGSGRRCSGSTSSEAGIPGAAAKYIDHGPA